MMNKILVASLCIAIAFAGGCAGCKQGNYVPFQPGSQNIINFGCGQGNSFNDLYGVSSAGLNFKYSNLPSWVTVKNGPMIAGTPASNAGASTITISYTDGNGNQRSQAIVLAPSGASPSTSVLVPNGISVNDDSTRSSGLINLNGAPSGPTSYGTVPLYQLPSATYIPGSTLPAANSGPTSGAPSTTLCTVVLPALAYPTPTRLSLVPPDAPTAGIPTPTAPTANPQSLAAIIARQQAAIGGLANALDAVNRANNNTNILNADLSKAQDDLNNALDYLQTTITALKAAQAAQQANSANIATVTNDIANLQSQIDATNRNINALKSKIADLTNQLNAATGNVPALQKALNDILAAITPAQQAVKDAQNALDAANSNIAKLRKLISDTQALIDAAPANVRKAQAALDAANNAVDAARKALNDALARQAAAQQALDDAKTILTTGPQTIANATNQINQIIGTLPGLQAALDAAKSNLTSLNNQRDAAVAAINANNKNIADLSNQLAQLKEQLAGLQPTLDAYNSQLSQANSQLGPLKNNQGILDDNVGTLTQQLGLAQNNANNARAAIDDINDQIHKNNDLLTAAKVALEKARTEKKLSDQEVNEEIMREGGTFPYPYIPGTGPYAMPGVTGNPQSNTVNPYAPGTIFGTGPGTTGSGVNSGLPVSAAPGSPYASQSSNIWSANGGSSNSGNLISSSQAANISPSSLYPAGQGSFGSANTGSPYAGSNGHSDCDSGNGKPSAGSGQILSINSNLIRLTNGASISFGGCSSITGTPKVGGSINWNGYTKQNSAFASKLTCY